MKKNKFLHDIGLIFALITRRDKMILFFLLFATLFLTLVETFGVSVIMPFITLATNPDLILNQRIPREIYNFFNFKNTTDFMITFSVVLVIFYIFRAVYNITYNYLLNRFVSRKYHYFSYSIFCRVLRSDYEKFSKKNLDEIRKKIVTDSLRTSQFLSSFLNIFAEISIGLLLYVILLIISWKMTMILTLFLGINVFLIVKGVGRAVDKQGQERSKSEEGFYKIISHTLSNFKIVKLRAKEEEDFRLFEQISLKRSRAQALYGTLTLLPRNILETIGFCILVACVGYILYSYGDAKAVLPIVSMYALALYRVLPSVTRILDHYNAMLFVGKAVEDIYEAMTDEEKVEGDTQVIFEKNIILKNIHFSYPGKRELFHGLDLEIKKGEKVAFVGTSGAGKSTLVDLIIGILQPKDGEILIDGVKLNSENIRSWRKKVGYIPQDIYLFDGSVGENITFGSKMDKKRLIEVAKMTKIYDFLQENNGFDTQVGDGGKQLSGGQRQRIGIARALYNNPDILVLDEATSALDTETESVIMDEIYNIAKNKTLLIIAHRLSTIERCEKKIIISKK
ncbi:ABC transporter ATP-binding protein [Helicobacter sp. faydin-H20]|uniref:ABC transporter ATP-binding protein/permease n=1 Tax=Helicobacter anatolicus TaxID=2905874 RepID=UPI001E37A59D|nr:ABC transporter ATP-binding protein [Helicobacter anatolicus]MCE3037174.1 ABC transporter ATP-binding protein [Helicobacter anatolicus]